MDDVVSALAHVMHMDNLTNYQKDVVDHAREEIVRLRYAGMDDADANEALDKCRAEALEKAAQLVWSRIQPHELADELATAIRALML